MTVQDRDKVDSKVGWETLAIVREQIFDNITNSVVREQVWDQVRNQVYSQIIRYNFTREFRKDIFQ